jgi:hypothetical protein
MPAVFPSVAINASNNSFAAVVEKAGVVIDVLAPERSTGVIASVAIAPQLGAASGVSRQRRTANVLRFPLSTGP